MHGLIAEREMRLHNLVDITAALTLGNCSEDAVNYIVLVVIQSALTL